MHRHRSVIVRQTVAGEQLSVIRIDNDPIALAEEIGKAGECPEVVLEATYGWYWAADVLAGAGASVRLAHPLGIKGFTYRRVKNDVRDAADLADLLRMGRLPEAWIAPTGHLRVAGVGAAPREAGRAALRVEGECARGAGQAGPAHPSHRPVGGTWPGAAA